ncbi:MAG: hypothetical protein HQK76_00775 [Desulfobacterales bacterium]|nr:hypothetical protein [Desulfobacterales bacterium]
MKSIRKKVFVIIEIFTLCIYGLSNNALNLMAKTDGIIIEGVQPHKIIIAPGPIQGMGRGDKWIFSFRDLRISRAPHIWIKADR